MGTANAYCQVPQDDRKATDAYMLTRDDKELYDQVFYRCSYLAKVATKPNGYRELFVSKQPKRK
jgi:hypothetical protein